MRSRLDCPDHVISATLEKKTGSRFQPWLLPTTSVYPVKHATTICEVRTEHSHLFFSC